MEASGADEWLAPSSTIDGLNLFETASRRRSPFDDLDELSAAAANPWLPAYGFHQPQTLLERDDFVNNPADADLFLQGGNNHYVYLETIQEETSDDLRSDSSISDSRPSPVGWLATDSESGSVIRMQTHGDDECESDREVACPAKRRRQEAPTTSDDESSLSRSSSLLQFESLEKQCQDISSSSPSIFSSFSFDSLERKPLRTVSPDSLERVHSDEDAADYYKVLKIDLLPKKKSPRQHSNDSLLYHSGTSSSNSSSSESADSEETLEAARYDSCKSVNLKTWRSFDGLHASTLKTVKISAENLSEDSGYSDHFYNSKAKSSSIPNMMLQYELSPPGSSGGKIYKTRVQIRREDDTLEKYRLKNVGDRFDAYDGDVFHTFTGNFGVSYHDLSIVEQYEQHRSPLIERFMRNGGQRRRTPAQPCLNLDEVSAPECGKYSKASASEPNLDRRDDDDDEDHTGDDTSTFPSATVPSSSQAVVSSVPKDLNLAGLSETSAPTIAAINCDLGDLFIASEMPKQSRYHRAEYGDKITIRLKYDTSSLSSNSDDVDGASSFKREGSYLEAMTHSIEMSDSEQDTAASNKHNHSSMVVIVPKSGRQPSTVYKFDRENALQAISETSLQSFGTKSIDQLNAMSPLCTLPPSTPICNRNVISTPNLAQIDDVVVGSPQRKSSLMNRSTSSSEVPNADDHRLNNPALKSLSGSGKGVHFSPVIAEVNWRDESMSTEREESSIESSPERAIPPRRLLTRSQPELHSRVVVISSDDSTDESRDLVHGGNAAEHGGNELRRKVVPSSRLMEEDRPACIRQQSQNERVQSAHVMETVRSPVVVSKVGAKSSRGIGGFFSRIASFRFSSRAAKNEEKKKRMSLKEQSAQNCTGQRLATKDDYIYIPLKGPESVKVNNNLLLQKVQVDGVDGGRERAPVGKPPLPKVPPRVVGASVKRRPEAGVVAATDVGDTAAQPSPFDGRQTIDSGVPHRPMEPMGLIETDLDTEVTVITSGAHVKTRSLMNLGHEVLPPTTTTNLNTPNSNALLHHYHHHHHDAGRPHKSMEFLLDKQNLKVVEPPENELQKGGVERVMSEHELRVQRSLQKLNVPEWYKAAQLPREGFLLKNNRESRWQGIASKTTSLSSLGSNATQSPVMLSPTTLLNAGGQPFVRWSTSKLNSTASSPCASTRSSFNASASTRCCQPNGSISPSSSLRSSFNYRQPYLGWRSQERLSRPRTPAERLANTILGGGQTVRPVQPQESPEIQTSIKEVTSAIVHYVSGLQPDVHSYDSQETASQRSRSASPRGSQKLCWLESSFVGSRPLDSPQTPLTLLTDHQQQQQQNHTTSSTTMPVPPTTLRLDLQSHHHQHHHHHHPHHHPHSDSNNALSTAGSRRPSPSSTTLEDVLDSLLGLPSSTRAPSPSLQGTASASTSPVHHRQSYACSKDPFRRRSEGSEPANRPSAAESRRASLNSSSPMLRCRNSRCGRTASKNSPSEEATQFKSCHNCAYVYCSRACRREHWEKHRKTCLFSRVGSLCRQVIAAAKEQEATLHSLSVIARRGFLSQGAGAVKIFFPRPDAAEQFLRDGLDSLGDPTYVRWPDLLPSEMGPQLYAELVKMCKNYNPDGRLVLYVSVCVVSEAPAAGAVKWERQLVSRCGKLRLSKSLHVAERDVEMLDAVILTSRPLHGQLLREAASMNIQRHLQQRGVALKRQYPDVYQQLASYVAGRRQQFTPVTIYPKDPNTGKPFMCIIMPDAQPECIEQVTTVGVQVRTVDVLDDHLVLEA